MVLNTIIGLAVFSWILVMTQPAYAYIDPVSGSLVFQGIVAFIAAGSLVIKKYFRAIVKFFKKDPPSSSGRE